MSTRKEKIELTADVILNSNISRKDLIAKLISIVETECGYESLSNSLIFLLLVEIDCLLPDIHPIKHSSNYKRLKSINNIDVMTKIKTIDSQNKKDLSFFDNLNDDDLLP